MGGVAVFDGPSVFGNEEGIVDSGARVFGPKGESVEATLGPEGEVNSSRGGVTGGLAVVKT
jgi:hypothetical protein